MCTIFSVCLSTSVPFPRRAQSLTVFALLTTLKQGGEIDEIQTGFARGVLLSPRGGARRSRDRRVPDACATPHRVLFSNCDNDLAGKGGHAKSTLEILHANFILFAG
ncbi:hypothetical protein EVAR_88671_1 [Eumeta japonica]|uniref:Uncharacterized protein n=1 Tax=Eumeta variegata TaxID=151549 RepID=A0A4C1Y7B6_EUMVA|nr:hypothetical protein EVAR_88671_1 [Eumeta japonica]